jgi:hypothetical protein
VRRQPAVVRLNDEIRDLERQVEHFSGFVESGIPLARKTIVKVGAILLSRDSAAQADNKIMRRLYDLTRPSSSRIPIRSGLLAVSDDIKTLELRRDMLIKRRDDHAMAVKIIRRVLTRGNAFMESSNPNIFFEEERDDSLSSGFNSRCGTAGSGDSVAPPVRQRRNVLRLPSIERPTIFSTQQFV